MTAYDSDCLSGLQLRGRHAEEDGLTVQGYSQRLHLFVVRQAHHRLIGVAVEVILQGNLAPKISQDIILRRVEVITAGHSRPFLAEHVAVGIFYLIIIAERSDRVLTRLDGRRLQFPMPAIVGRHHQSAVLLRAVETHIGDDHPEVLTPLCTVFYREFQFHILIILLQRYKKVTIQSYELRDFCNFAAIFQCSAI